MGFFIKFDTSKSGLPIVNIEGLYVIISKTNTVFVSLDIDWNKVSKGAKIRNRYNQVPHLTQGTNGKVPNSQ